MTGAFEPRTAGALGLDRIETAPIEELQALQLERLRTQLQHAYHDNVRYTEKFDSAGVKPEDLQALSELQHFPFTRKVDLRNAYPFGFFAVGQAQLARIHASSGTTGQPTVVGYTQSDLNMWASVVARSIYAAGGRPGMKIHVAYGYGLFTGGLGAHYGAEALGCTVVPVSGGQTKRQVQLIQDLQPDIIMVTPSYMLAILDEFVRQGVDPRSTSLKIGIFGAEPWGEGMRGEIEQAFGIDAVDIYGLSEVMGPGVAQECVIDKGALTFWEDHFYPEIVDPESGAVLGNGEEGELVITSLTKEAMPVIRYRTGDLTRLMEPTSRSMRRVARIGGRTDDMLIVRGANIFPSQIEEHILSCGIFAPHYLIEVTRPERLDEMRVRVEARPGIAAADWPAAARELMRRVKEHVGVSIGVEVVEPGKVERSDGKARRVQDLRRATD